MPHRDSAAVSTQPPMTNRATSRACLYTPITSAYRLDESAAVASLLAQTKHLEESRAETYGLAKRIATALRNQKASGGKSGVVQELLQEFSLSSKEGIALMCLAEALLRIPDNGTRDALIRDKVAAGDWQRHTGNGSSLFVNAASWGLLITGRLTATRNEAGLGATLTRIIAKGGEPLIRKGVDMAMRVMGSQFVTGETISEALKNAQRLEKEGFRYSYDMLGEAALTEEDALRYLKSYEDAIHSIGKRSAGRGIYEGPGISIKLSALHCRYVRAKIHRIEDELYPRLLSLVLLAKQYDIGLNIDAEEADRLEISLQLLERLCNERQLSGWNGIGFVIQAYQKRCPFVIDLIIDVARKTGHRLMIRLVKGAYWDSEIKRAQVDGLEDYPVYTRKVHTDLAYLACAKKLLDAPDAIYPQFATHNAHSLAAIYKMAGNSYFPGQYEFQCLHGMGEPLYRQVVGPVSQGKLDRPCRIYAPVGSHETLLAYLVRRLLENGANTSFVNRIADESLSIDSLIEEPIETIQKVAAKEGIVGLPHPQIGLPVAMFASRDNSQGLDLSSEFVLNHLEESRVADDTKSWSAGPIINGELRALANYPVRNPSALGTVIGHVSEAGKAEVNDAITTAVGAFESWAAIAPAIRSQILNKAADLMEGEMVSLLGLLSKEAGKTYANAIAEVREAVDFLRFYGNQVEQGFQNERHKPLGPIVCISPWNFPLAIFAGQVSAALAAGNTVLAKPAEQTPLIAAVAVRILHQAGVPAAALHLLPGRGEVTGAALIEDTRIKGVMFTGSTEVAKLIASQIAGRLDASGQFIPLIAETGGQNAMLVDSSALPEQVVNDVIASAFDSAGQRCSALRILCVQEEIADTVVHMLKGAMSELAIGDPSFIANDVGPVIDYEAKQIIVQHVEKLKSEGCQIFQGTPQAELDRLAGSYVAPTLIELHELAQLKREVFGPVLHVVRYARKNLKKLLREINALGYGLTMGLHTRIDETIAEVVDLAKVGNLYVNRNIVGAVVGAQPFGGEGLSGTGPKAGGPLYALRLLATRPLAAPYDGITAPSIAVHVDESVRSGFITELAEFQKWGVSCKHFRLNTICPDFAESTPSGITCTLPGPTGERNLYTVLPRELILCQAQTEEDLVTQLAAIVAVGSNALVARSFQSLVDTLPRTIRERVTTFEDWRNFHFDGVIFHGERAPAEALAREVIKARDEIISVIYLPKGGADVPLERLVLERSISINTTAAGGNASLMTID
ncbi:TPA: trifunctional transcriptional regulator/proline dehydrogenase/L-glutamate gamma-semialdehyde dehydrogenase [Pseudomonas putida]|nr:trifunctional transcriptional regulator/proline dehydrogenase/L-glutamate gamma-semialdehyde dehydrogenase [Pseudomonas putida]